MSDLVVTEPASTTVNGGLPDATLKPEDVEVKAELGNTTDTTSELKVPEKAEADGQSGEEKTAGPTDGDLPVPILPEDEELAGKVLQQVEFYFSDANLPYDKFLFGLWNSSPDHWVPIATIASFKRMRDYTKAKGVRWIAEVVKRSPFLLEVNVTGENVRRRPALTPNTRGDAFNRSIYAKGFGEETPTLQLEIEDMMSKYGKFNVVRMRRDNETRKFKGSVFVEFIDQKTMDTFLKADPKPTWKGEELVIMSKRAYCDMKIAEKGISGEEAHAPRTGFNGFKILSIEKEKERKTKDPGKKQVQVWIEVDGEKYQVQADGKVDESKLKYEKGSILRFEGSGKNVQWGEIKDPLKEDFPNIFIQHKNGEDAGLVRFGKGPLTDEQIEKIRSAVKTVGGQEVTWRNATDEEEKAYHLERANHIAGRALHRKKQPNGKDFASTRGGRGGGRGGRGGGAGRGGRREGASEDKKADSKQAPEGSTKAEKPKREIDGDSVHDQGKRNQGVPVIVSAVGSSPKGEKRKREEEDGAPADAKRAKVEDSKAMEGVTES